MPGTDNPALTERGGASARFEHSWPYVAILPLRQNHAPRARSTIPSAKNRGGAVKLVRSKPKHRTTAPLPCTTVHSRSVSAPKRGSCSAGGVRRHGGSHAKNSGCALIGA